MQVKGNFVNIEEMRKALNQLSLAGLDLDDEDNELDSDSDCLIIGLDFGTTYSGSVYRDIYLSITNNIPARSVAYAFSAAPEMVCAIQEWDGAPGRQPLKVPTILKYENQNIFRWGYDCGQTTPGRIEGLKLLLDPQQPKPIYLPQANTKSELSKLGKPPIDVATDYISAIYLHAIRKIEGKNPKGYIDTLKKKFVLTVPAVWSDKAKDATLQVRD
jgi:hypothetical protein